MPWRKKGSLQEKRTKALFSAFMGDIREFFLAVFMLAGSIALSAWILKITGILQDNPILRGLAPLVLGILLFVVVIAVWHLVLQMILRAKKRKGFNKDGGAEK